MASELVDELTSCLTGLADGTGDRVAAARWAEAVMEADDPVWRDDAVWSALERLSVAADLAADGKYVHGPDDFRGWLRTLEEELRRDE